MHRYSSCELCERRCGIDRTKYSGYCGEGSTLRISRASLHMWEEPPISGTRGSGTIFFSGCSLGCVFCQNRAISGGSSGIEVSVEKLSEIMLRLESEGGHNINLVTPTHYVPSIAEAIRLARSRGLSVPIVYNTGSFDTPETIRSLNGLVDIYLPDFKYYRKSTAKALSNAESYPDAARSAIAEMVRQTGRCILDGNGIMQKGTVVRILLLPDRLAEAKLILKYLADTYGSTVAVSLMNQYTPMPGMIGALSRRVTREEYRQLLAYAEKLGIENGYVQDGGTASESFIPDFDNTGVY